MRTLFFLGAFVALWSGTVRAEDWTSLMEAARGHARAGRLTDCENTLRRALATLDDSGGIRAAQTHEALASVYAEGGKPLKAVDHYSKALRLRETHRPRRLQVEAHILYAIASLWRSANRMDDALASARLAVERATAAGEKHSRTLARAREHLALVLSERHEFEEAEREFERALAILGRMLPAGHPDVGLCHLNRGWNQFHSGKIKAAAESFELARRVFEDVVGAHSEDARNARYGLAYVKLVKGNLDEAMRAFTVLISDADQAGSRDEADALVCLCKAGMLLDSGIADGVSELLERSEKFVPIGTEIRRGQLAALNGEFARALRSFEAAERLLAGAPSKAELVTRLHADALIRAGQTKKARSLLKTREPQMRRVRANLHCLLAACHLAEGQSAEAVKAAKAAIAELKRIDSRRVEIFALAEILLGDALRQSGESDPALMYYRRAHERISSQTMPMPELRGRARLGMARIRRCEGDPAEATKLFQSAIASFKRGAPVVQRMASPAVAELAELLSDRGSDAGADRTGAEEER